MNEVYQIFTDFTDKKSSAMLTVEKLLKCRRNAAKISEINSLKIDDAELLKKIILCTNNEQNKEDIWEDFIFFINPGIIDDFCFNYFWENNICLNTLSHLELKDKYLKKLSNYYDEAYIVLAKRYYRSDNYSDCDFAELLIKCKYESVFYNLFLYQLYQKNITSKGHILNAVIQKNIYLSSELKSFSQRVFEAQILYCTDNIDMIETYYNKRDYIFMYAISCNPYAPKYILEELTRISDIKFASKIREKSIETLKIKCLLNI